MKLPDTEYTIEWDPNPLKSRVTLTEFGVEYLRLRLYVERLEDRLFDLAYHQQVPDKDTDERVEEWANKLVPELVAELHEIHVGDCTCVPCSCSKCLAEDLVGIRTISGLGKHEASKVGSLFREHDNIDDVLAALENYDARDNPPTWEGWEPHVERWNREAANAFAWLTAYKEEHDF